MVMRGWDFQLVRIFVQTGQSADALESAADADSSAMTRLWSAGMASAALLLCLLGLVPTRKFFRATGSLWLVLFAGIFTLSLMSGFRLMTFSLLVIAGLTLFFQKGFTAPRMLALFLAGCSGIAFVYLFSRQFPNSIQRAISWLPGIDISSIASGDASQTVEWRLRLWKEALRYFPDYWLVGKGFSYDKMEFIYAFQSLDDLRWALVSGSYHNGWLSMLLCTGIIGTILCLILLVAPLIRHWKRQYSSWKDPFLKRLHGVFLAALTTTAAAFVLIYGEVHTSFPVIFFYWAILETLSHADEDTPGVLSDEDSSLDSSESVYQEASD
jgi:O-antigen ligase